MLLIMLEGYPKERGFCDLTEEEKDYLLSRPMYGTEKWAKTILKAANKDKDLEEKYGKEYIAMQTEEEKERHQDGSAIEEDDDITQNNDNVEGGGDNTQNTGGNDNGGGGDGGDGLTND